MHYGSDVLKNESSQDRTLEKIKIQIGEKLQQVRKKAGLSQEELVGQRYSKAYVSRVEHGQILPSEDFVTHISLRLNITPLELLQEIDLSQIPSLQSLLKSTYSSEEDPSVGKVSRKTREFIELELQTVEIAVEAREFEKARHILTKFQKENLGKDDLKAQYHYLMGKLYFEEADYGAALADLQEALKLYLDTVIRPDTLKVERVRNLIGLAYYRQNNFLIALEYHQRCWDAFRDDKIQDRHFRMLIYYNLANDYYCLNMTEQALKLYKEAAKLADEVSSLKDLAGIYWGIALTFRASGNLGMTKQYLDRSASIYQSINQLKLAGSVKGILGLIFLDTKEYEAASTTLDFALTIALQMDDDASAARASTNLAYMSYLKGDLLQAERQAELGVEKARKSKDNLILGQILAQLADVRLAQNRTEEGLTLYREGITLLEETGSREYLKDVYGRYAKALEASGDIKTALEIFHKAIDVSKQRELP